MKRLIVLKLLFLFVFSFCPNVFCEEREPAFEVYLTDQLEQGNEKNSFSCGDPIIGKFRWLNLTSGKHSLEAFWYNPKKELQETTIHEFEFSEKQIVDSWVRLKLQRGKSKSFFFPETGWEEFLGDWKLEIFLDGNFLKTKKFNVIC
jgi:hypothetical protein